MLIIPAIDLKDGCVVRFVQGRLNKKVYSRDPVKTARHWVRQGAEYLHVVDLDGAYSGVQKNLAVVKKIAGAVAVPLEFGGGVRSLEAVRKALRFGVKRVVLGTRAIEDRGFLKEAFAEFGKRVIVSADCRNGRLLVKGWQRTSKLTGLDDFLSMLEKLGFRELIYTDTLKDGTLSGANIKGVGMLLKKTGMGIIASGGISSLEDIRKLKRLEKAGLAGIIIGKALYEGKITLSEALSIAEK